MCVCVGGCGCGESKERVCLEKKEGVWMCPDLTNTNLQRLARQLFYDKTTQKTDYQFVENLLLNVFFYIQYISN